MIPEIERTMVKITIDEREIEAREGTTVFHAAQDAGIPIPHFCYHPAFAPEGTCRMCLVEIEGMPKLELACSTQIREGMKVFTQSERVREGRMGVLEFLLAEHPLDCPICDQAGDCKLQDYYEEYGLHDSRFSETKEKHEKKVRLGKYLLHDQERCVLCRRCVRFLREVTGTDEMGVFERGGHTEVNVNEEGQEVSNNYSGNLGQICPVGAITDTDFRFQTRSWFLEEGESVCPLCSRGCRISIQSHRGFARFRLPKRVYRIKAVKNPRVNGPWICDMGRYGYKYLDEGRATRILKKDGPAPDWPEAIAWLGERILRLKHRNRLDRITVILTSRLTNEELFLAKKIFRDDLGVRRFYFADTPPGEGDSLLLTPERTPNRKGAEEIGWDLVPVDLDALAGETDLLLVFGPDFETAHSLSDILGSFEQAENTVLVTPFEGELNAQVDLLLPAAPVAEKAGSLTNTDGVVQSFTPALPALGSSRAEWSILADLGKALSLEFQYYSRFMSPEIVFQEMTGEIPFFEKNGE
jgi:NADH-quinone oxidoreductase subunit G